MKKKCISLLLALTLCLSLMPAGVLADEEPETTEPAAEETMEAAVEETENIPALTAAEGAEDPTETKASTKEDAPAEAPTDTDVPVEESAETDVPAENETAVDEEVFSEITETVFLTAANAEIIASGTCGADGDNLTWTLDGDGTLTISGEGEMADYSESGAPWYDQKDSIVTVVVEDSVTSIGSYAFYKCSGLMDVAIPDGVMSIGSEAFNKCSSLTSMTIPDSVTRIWSYAFADCTSLISVIIGSGMTELGYAIFSGCKSLTSVTIPDSVTCIEGYAFHDCKSLTSVTIPDNVTSIGYAAFDGCSGLTRIIIPDSVGNIGAWAFSHCTNLTSVTISNGLTDIKEYTFSECYSLTSVTIPSSVTTIGEEAFSWCTKLTSVIIEHGVKSIDAQAFSECRSLTSITIPDSVASIGEKAFSCCYNLTYVSIGNNVVSIGDSAFGGCGSLTAIDVASDNVEYTSADGVLYDKEQTKLIKYPSQKENETFAVPDSVISIEDAAFYNCGNLTSVDIIEGVKNIGEASFAWCENLVRVEIPDSVISIGNSAFFHCESLTSATIPNGVKSLENSAFEYCSSLASVTIPDGVTSIGGSSFDHCTSLTSVTIPNSVTSIGIYAFYHCDSLTSVTISSRVKNIGEQAFDYCGSLKNVYYGGSKSDWEAISIGSRNDCLTSATIHYNSGLNFDESSLFCDVGDTIALTASYVSESVPGDVLWSCGNENAVAFSGTSFQGPSVTGEDNTYWISVQITAKIRGTYDITLDVDGHSAAVSITISETGTMGIGVLTDIDENLNLIFIDEENAYTATESDVARMKELLKNKKISDKRVIFEYTEYNAIVSVYSVYDVLCLQTTNVQASPGTLEYGTDGTYQTDTIDITADVYVTIDISADAARPYTEGEIESLGKENLYLDSNDVTLTIDRISNIIYFGKTLWVKSTKKDVEIDAATIGYGYDNKVSVAVSADVDDGEEPEEASASVVIAKFYTSAAGEKNLIYASECKVEVTNICEAEKENELAELLKSYENANVDVMLNSSLYYADGSSIGANDIEVMKYIVKMLELEAIASLEDGSADNWAERLGNIAANQLESALLSKLGLSSSMIGGTETIYVYASYTGATGQTAYLKIPVCIYTQGGKSYGAFNPIYYSTDNKDWQQVGGITYYNMGAFADCMISYVKMAYNEAWGKDANKAASYIVGQPLTDLFNTFKAVNLGASILGLNVKLPTSVSDGIFEFCLRQTKKCVSIKCPVDVYVYNSAGQLCGAIESNEINPYFSDENVVCSVDGDEKYVTLYSDNYSILLVGTDSGTMEYQIDEYDSDELVRSVTTVDIPLEDGMVYCGSVPYSLYTSAEIYELICDGEGEEDTAIPVTRDTLDTSDDPETGIPGDINGDGSVNNKDLNRLMKYLLNNSTVVVQEALDVNGDGSVNNKDLNRLMKYLLNSAIEIH